MARSKKEQSLDPLDVHIGRRLRQARESMKLSLLMSGEIIDVGQQQMSRFELGRNRLAAGQLYRLARAYGKPVSWFYEGFVEDEAELGRLRNIIREERAEWSPTTRDEREAVLLHAWRRVADDARQAVIVLLEAMIRASK
jgi:transcriptional regulator with XRE-family HTH domain